jgi:hypothetical protein
LLLDFFAISTLYPRPPGRSVTLAEPPGQAQGTAGRLGGCGCDGED